MTTSWQPTTLVQCISMKPWLDYPGCDEPGGCHDLTLGKIYEMLGVEGNGVVLPHSRRLGRGLISIRRRTSNRVCEAGLARHTSPCLTDSDGEVDQLRSTRRGRRIVMRATLGTSSNRRAPAAPGFTTSVRRRARSSCLMRVAVHDHVGRVAREQLLPESGFPLRDRGSRESARRRSRCSIAGGEPRIARHVGVAVHRTHRRDQLELVEDRRRRRRRRRGE